MLKQTGPQRWRIQDPMGPLWLLVLGALGSGGTGVYALYYGLSRLLRGRVDPESLLTGSALVVAAVVLAGVVGWLRVYPPRKVIFDGSRRQVAVYRRRQRVAALSFDQALPVRVERVSSLTDRVHPSHWELFLPGVEQHICWTTSPEEAEDLRQRLHALLAPGQDGPAREDP